MSAKILKFPVPPPCVRCERPGEVTLPCPECGEELCGTCYLPHTDAHEAEEGSGLDWSV